jgi:universal stress protein E
MVLNKLFVIIDPTTDGQPAFERALLSAHMTGTRLHLYACVPGDDEAQCAALQSQLEGMVKRCIEEGVEADWELERGDDWSAQAVSAAARCAASLVFKSSFTHASVQRQLRPTSDFTLLRLSPCPVLLVKDQHDWHSRRVVAAVNSQSVDDAHARLNNLVVSLAQNFTDAYGSDVHFVTAYADANNPPDAEALAQRFGAPIEYIHVARGSAAEVIAEQARSVDADLIIIGTVGRSGIKGRVVGNTAEKVLDHTDADVLVVN